MRIFYKYLRQFIAEDFQLASYLYTATFLLLAFGINYSLDVEDSYIDAAPQEYRGLLYLGFYAIAWFGVAIPVLYIRKEFEILKNKKFWILASILILTFSVDAGFYHHRIWFKGGVNLENQLFMRRIFVNVFSMFFYVIVFYLLKKRVDEFSNLNAFGLAKSTPLWKSYIGLWMMMLPLLAWASFQEDFINYYPEFKPWKYAQIFGYNPWKFVPVYEFCYAIDFVAVEWMFRGALVIGMARIMGRHAILPMVSFYAFIHFGKPMAEAIGSIFGGYILGILALSSGSIWGGCLVHIGIAITMDLLALLQFWKDEY
jgi:hypothetical protein